MNAVVQLTKTALKKVYTAEVMSYLEMEGAEIGMSFANVDEISLQLQNTRVDKHDEKVGSYQCSADLIGSSGGKTAKTSISYSSRLANGGKKSYFEIQNLTEKKVTLFVMGLSTCQTDDKRKNQICQKQLHYMLQM